MNDVRSTSYHWPAVPVTVPEPRTVVPAIGLSFHVKPVSLHALLPELRTVNPALAACVLSRRPNRRSLAELTVLMAVRSNFRYVSRFQPVAPFLTCSTVAVPKLVFAWEPSRTYASA